MPTGWRPTSQHRDESILTGHWKTGTPSHRSTEPDPSGPGHLTAGPGLRLSDTSSEGPVILYPKNPSSGLSMAGVGPDLFAGGPAPNQTLSV